MTALRFMPARRERALFFRHVGELVAGHCWLWTGATLPQGYGQFRLDGKGTTAHRAAWTLFRGPIPAGYQVDHLCRVKACVNPDHLEPVTQAENLRRQAAAVTHCPRGHGYTPDNTYVGSKNERRCRTCARERQRVAR